MSKPAGKIEKHYWVFCENSFNPFLLFRNSTNTQIQIKLCSVSWTSFDFLQWERYRRSLPTVWWNRERPHPEKQRDFSCALVWIHWVFLRDCRGHCYEWVERPCFERKAATHSLGREAQPAREIWKHCSALRRHDLREVRLSDWYYSDGRNPSRALQCVRKHTRHNHPHDHHRWGEWSPFSPTLIIIFFTLSL